MKKNLSVPQTLSNLGLELPKDVNPKTRIIALESDYAKAGSGTLTYLNEKSPAALYRSTAGAILVPKALRNIIPRDESVQIIPVDNPKEIFSRLSELLG